MDKHNNNFIYDETFYDQNYIINQLQDLSINNNNIENNIDNKKTLVLLLFSINTPSDISIQERLLKINKYITKIFLTCTHYNFLHIKEVDSDFVFTLHNINTYVESEFKNAPNILLSDKKFWIMPFLQLRNIYVAGIILFNEKPNVLLNVRHKINILASLDKDNNIMSQDNILPNEMYLLKKILKFKYNIELNINGNNITFDLCKILQLYYKYFVKVKIEYITFQPLDYTNNILFSKKSTTNMDTSY